MSFSKQEKMSVVGTLLAVLFIVALFGVNHAIKQFQAKDAALERESLNQVVGMREPIILDSSQDSRFLSDGSNYGAGLLWDGAVSLEIADAKLFHSTESVGTILGDDAWVGDSDLSVYKEYLICSVMFDGANASPTLTSADGVPVFNAGFINVNHGGEMLAMSAPVESSSPHDGFNFAVGEDGRLSFDVVFGFGDSVDCEDLQLWFGTTANKRYRCDLSVGDCRE